ncbi:hypothetical protein B6U67_05140 [Methanosarcinales archaeon ex4484_138]|nr:MAG: hypothetical protein B6U67_05140 [Methanosarcinales archaeon ex4484_138]
MAKASIIDPMEEVFYCTTCNLCRENCPVEIPVKDILLKQRREYVKKEKKARMVYFKGCMSTFRREEIAQAAEDLLDKTGADYTLIDERCCGSPILKTGSGIEELIDYNISRIEESGAETILFTCPGCLDTFKNHYPEKYDLLHISEYLKEEVDAGKIQLKEVGETVTYHKPCHLRTDAPEEIIRKIPGTIYKEIKEGCCGAGGGVRSAYPEISKVIAEERLKVTKETGAETILSACPFCKDNLKEGEQPIKDLTEYLNEIRDDRIELFIQFFF